MLADSTIPNSSLAEFIKQYEELANQATFDPLVDFIATDATYWFSNGSYVGIEAIRQAFESTWARLKDETYTISDVQWLVATNSEAVCIYKFISDSIVNGKRSIYTGRGTNIFKRIDGRWQIVHEHLSKDK